MGGDQLSRQWQILRQIELSKNGLTASEIAELRGISLSTAYRDLDEIKQWIMSLGPEAYVVEPEKLKNMVKADLKKALVQYEGTIPAYLRPQARKSRSDFFS